MPVDAPELVKEALAVSSGSRGELSRRLGLRGYGEDRIGRWLRSESKPRYDETIMLLELVGRLSKAEGHRSGAEGPADPQEALAAAAVDLAKGQAQLLEELRDLRAALEDALAQRRGRPRRKSSG